MKTIVTFSDTQGANPSYREATITTTLYDEDGEDIGLASITVSGDGRFRFRVNPRYVSETQPKWIDAYNTADIGSVTSLELWNVVKDLVRRQDIKVNTYCVVNDLNDEGWDENKKKGWNKVLDIVNQFLLAIDPEYRLFPPPGENEKVRNCMYRLPPILSNAGDQCSLFRAPCNGTGKDCGLRMHTPESRKRLEV